MEEERKFRESLVRSPEEVLNRTKKGSFRSGESGPNSQEDFPASGMNQSESRTGKLITRCALSLDPLEPKTAGKNLYCFV